MALKIQHWFFERIKRLTSSIRIRLSDSMIYDPANNKHKEASSTKDNPHSISL